MEEPSAALHRWLDKAELDELVAVLSSAVDRGDRERIEACYTDDSYDDHGSFKGTGAAFAEFVCGRGAMTAMHHLLGQSVFAVEGEEAWGETFFVFHGRAGDVEIAGHGRYVDYFRKVQGRWRVAYRRVVPESVPAGDELAAYWTASRDRADPSYDRRRSPGDDRAGGAGRTGEPSPP